MQGRMVSCVLRLLLALTCTRRGFWHSFGRDLLNTGTPKKLFLPVQDFCVLAVSRMTCCNALGLGVGCV